jgi:DNA-binding MarR family transcriptional regulator
MPAMTQTRASEDGAAEGREGEDGAAEGRESEDSRSRKAELDPEGPAQPADVHRAPESGEARYRLSQSPSHLLRRAQQLAADIFTRAGMEDAVTLRQTIVLAAIAESEGRSQAELVHATGVDRSTLAEMMARMEKRGLIERLTARLDMRAKAVRLTPMGRERLASALPAIEQADAALMQFLPRARRKGFADTLAALTSAGVAAEEARLAAARAAKAEARARKAAEKAGKARKKHKKKRRKKKR